MSSRPRFSSGCGLEQWAAARAPELLARAEAEAVAVLREALVAASLANGAGAGEDTRPGAREDTPPQAPPDTAPTTRASRPNPSEEPDLLWAYCVLRDGDATPAGARGIGEGAIQRVEHGGLAALVSRVPAAEFAEEPLRRNLGDLGWLEQVARAHEAVLDAALAQSTIVPLRMCTLFESDERVGDMLERRGASLGEALDALEGRFEWAVKVLVDPERLLQAAGAADAGAASESEPPPARSGEGGAYLRRRREERGAREAASGLAADTARQIHARLQDWALDARTSPPQNRELSGHEGEMVLNAAYLIERERTEELRALIAELEEHHRGLGARIELTGPWPPYNFVPGGHAPTPA
jgi:hypothetical protein